MATNQTSKLFYLVIGYAAMLLVGLGALRYVGDYYNQQGYWLTFSGFLLMSLFIQFVEKEMGLKGTKALWIVKGSFMVLFVILGVWLYII